MGKKKKKKKPGSCKYTYKASSSQFPNLPLFCSLLSIEFRKHNINIYIFIIPRSFFFLPTTNMKFAVSTILFAGAGVFFSTVANAAGEDPKQFDFPLRAWVNPRDTSVPRISHYVEIDMAGNAVINKTEGSQGIRSVCHVHIVFIIIIIISILFIQIIAWSYRAAIN